MSTRARKAASAPPRCRPAGAPAADRVGGDRHPLTIRPVRRRRRYGVPLRVPDKLPGRRVQDPAILVLEDGRTFPGEAFGAPGETFGEAVFSTGMTGYQETLTDPSYHRQVVVMTAPHVGNTGMNDEDQESRRIWVSGLRRPRPRPRAVQLALAPRASTTSSRDQGVVGISGIDTRALTRHLRERGAMRVGISSTETDPQALLQRVLGAAEMAGAELADEVTTAEAYVVPGRGREAVHRRGGRPRHQVDDPADDERARHRGARAAGRPPRSTTCVAHAAPTGSSSPTAPATRRPRRRRSSCCRARSSGDPLLRHLLRQPALRPGARASAPSSSSTATAASTSR